MSIRYLMSLADYKSFFKSNTEIKDNEEPINLLVEPIKYENDKEYQYSIKWTNIENDETGFIYRINTSSLFALKSCEWGYEEEESDEE